MRRSTDVYLESCRMNHPDNIEGDIAGWYTIRFLGVDLTVIASYGEDWDHVSVSTPTRTPFYEEMEHIRGLFFKSHETVIQYSVPRKLHISDHDYVLHMWRPQKLTIPLPPAWMV